MHVVGTDDALAFMESVHLILYLKPLTIVMRNEHLRFQLREKDIFNEKKKYHCRKLLILVCFREASSSRLTTLLNRTNPRSCSNLTTSSISCCTIYSESVSKQLSASLWVTLRLSTLSSSSTFSTSISSTSTFSTSSTSYVTKSMISRSVSVTSVIVSSG